MSDPELVLDGSAPVQQQIAAQICRLILGGVLRPGEELPSVRAVAVGLGVSPRAVEQAYERLERAGLVNGTEGCGPRVALPPGPADADLKRLCADFWRAAAGRGYSPAAVLHALQACLEEELSHEQAP